MRKPPQVPWHPVWPSQDTRELQRNHWLMPLQETNNRTWIRERLVADQKQPDPETLQIAETFGQIDCRRHEAVGPASAPPHPNHRVVCPLEDAGMQCRPGNEGVPRLAHGKTAHCTSETRC